MAALADRSPPRKKGRTSAAVSDTGIQDLTDGLLVDIFSRVPASSHYNSKLVCRRWINLIDHPDHRIRLPQPLAGFFYNSTCLYRFPISAVHFVNASGCGRPFIYPSFAFLPSHRRLDLLDCCKGLLLCRCYYVSARNDEFQYVVCNPVTEEWVAFPDPCQAAGEVGTASLGFNPAVSSHFHVFMLLEDSRRYLTGVDVYSSETGGWIHKEEGWGNNIRLADPGSATAFLNGHLHFRAVCGDQLQPCVAAVDTKAETWLTFNTPHGLFSGDLFLDVIQQLQGRLHYASLNNDNNFDVQLQVYALECYANKEWILKHRVGVEDAEWYCEWIAIDPECNFIFFIVESDKSLRRYDMDHQQTRELCLLGEGQTPYLPYVPLYMELESLHK